MWRRHGVDSKAGQTRNAWRHCGFVLTPLATPCRSTLGARLFSVPNLSGLKMALALACLFIGHDTRLAGAIIGLTAYRPWFPPSCEASYGRDDVAGRLFNRRSLGVGGRVQSEFGSAGRVRSQRAPATDFGSAGRVRSQRAPATE